MPITDKARRKKGHDAWREANAEADAERKRAWYEANKSAVIARQRERRELARLEELSRREIFAGFEVRGRRVFPKTERIRAGLTKKDLKQMLEALG